jgi:hypothetical protein
LSSTPEPACPGTPRVVVGMNDEAKRISSGDQQRLVASAEEMLDYAIIAGAELKNPKFVSLLRLARRALLNQDQASPSADGGSATSRRVE